jgi:uncharacterized membrane protein (UPF0127 family)
MNAETPRRREEDDEPRISRIARARIEFIRAIRVIREIRGLIALNSPRLRVSARVISSLFLLIVLSLSGCGGGSATDTSTQLPTTTMQIAGQKFVLEKATTPGQQTIGLMHRDTMAPDHGMIFIYKEDSTESYWNHDVRFGLDNLFVDADGKIVSIQHMDAYDETPTKPCTYRYVIELNAGVPAKLGLKEGDVVSIPGDAK